MAKPKTQEPDRGDPERPRLDDVDLSDAAGTALADDADFEGVAVRDVDWSSQGASRVTFERCRLERVVLIGAELATARLVDVSFVDCDLSGAWFTRADATRVSFHGCRMEGVILTDGMWRDVRISDSKVDTANMRMSRFERFRFERCRLPSADFYGATLAGGRVIGCDLTGAEFSKSDFRATRLHGSTLAALRGSTHLRGVRIESTQAVPLGLQLLEALDIVVDDDDDDSSG